MNDGSQGAVLVDEVNIGDDYHHPPQPLMRGVKRTRSVADLGNDDDDEDDGEGEGDDE